MKMVMNFNLKEMKTCRMTVEQFLVWFHDYAREEHNGDKGLAWLELELQGCLDYEEE